MNDTNTETPKRSNATLWLLIAISVIPFIAATAYYKFGNFNEFGNNGDLINPVIDIQNFKLSDEAGNVLERESLTRKWRMILIVGKDCVEICKTSLYNMRQMNVALGKHYDRFRHMLIHTEMMSSELSELINAEYKDALHAYSNKAIMDKELGPVESNIYSNYIYIMDPIGNIMMRFKPGMNPKVILKDLNRLLKVSQIG
jgi:cytochrome oxidase Cu insertion factor (SCO1/SenC/PrrC family)